MSKYDPLAQYLATHRKRSVRLKFSEIESIIGTTLPASATKHQSWWNGNSAVWIVEGRRAIPNLRKKRVDFRRDKIAQRLLAQRTAPPRRMRVERKRTRKQRKLAAHTGEWGGVHFERVCQIEPRREGKRIIEERPQSRYDNKRNLPLHQWGEGPFCRFQIPVTQPIPGVYVITVDGDVRYVGETENLSVRYNNGHGTISPRNCLVGGQSTNCRINAFILGESSQGQVLVLRFAPRLKQGRGGSNAHSRVAGDLESRLEPQPVSPSEPTRPLQSVAISTQAASDSHPPPLPILI